MIKKQKKRRTGLKVAGSLLGAAALGGGGYALYKRGKSNKPYTPGKKSTVPSSPQTQQGIAQGRQAKAAYKQSKAYKQSRATSVPISSKGKYVTSSNTRSPYAKSQGVKKAYTKQSSKAPVYGRTSKGVVFPAGKAYSPEVQKRAQRVKSRVSQDQQNALLAKAFYAVNQAGRKRNG